MVRVSEHVPVLLEEAIGLLQVRAGGVYVDATLGLAGHAAAIARRLGGKGRLICFDRDPEAMKIAQGKLAGVAAELKDEMPDVVFVAKAFSEVAAELQPESIDGLLADFGVSSLQLDEAHRGFSFRADGPLDMRMDTRGGETAEQVVNQVDEDELANLIYEFGEERRSRRIARAIVRARPITTTEQLSRVVSAAAPSMKTDKIHAATRTFQAIRMRVNNELGEIQALLRDAPKLLRAGGRLVAISFHSLEDRLVKDSFRELSRDFGFELLTRKPIIAAEQEGMRNPRSRSAKMRGVEKLAGGARPDSSSEERYRRRKQARLQAD